MEPVPLKKHIDMRHITLTICSALLIIISSNQSKAQGSSSKKSTTKAEPAPVVDSAAMMKAWMDYITPGEMHKIMASTDGTWEGDFIHYMGEGAPPQKSTATATFKTVYNGLFQESIHQGSFAGMQFEGKGVLAYDNAKKKFISTWYDNMGSGIMILEGDFNPTTKTYTFAGKATNPLTKQDCVMREIVKIIDNDNQVMEMYGPDPVTGKEYKAMEIVMKRKK
jgi:hypothetical protein